MTIKQLQKICHKIAKEKGFWDRKVLYADNEKYVKIFEEPNIGEKLMLIVSELGEALEALRKEDLLSKSDKFYARAKSKVKWRPNSFEDELADTIIRICDLAEYMGIDLEWHLKKKIAYNKKRPYKHNKKF